VVGLFLLGFPNKILYAFLTYPIHAILVNRTSNSVTESLLENYIFSRGLTRSASERIVEEISLDIRERKLQEHNELTD
jgi:hypothetical protein